MVDILLIIMKFIYMKEKGNDKTPGNVAVPSKLNCMRVRLGE